MQTQNQQPTVQDFKIELQRHAYKVDVLERLVDGIKKEIKKYQPSISNQLPEVSKPAIINDPLQLARLEQELIERSELLFHQKRGYDFLLKHANQHEAVKKQQDSDLADLTKEVNENFEWLLTKAKALPDNKEIAKCLRTFEAGKLEILKDQTSKNTFFVNLKALIG